MGGRVEHAGRTLRSILLSAGLCLVVSVASCAAPSPPDFSKGGKIHVAAIQVTEGSDGLAANQANIERLVRAAAARGARYILLPEYYPGQIANRPGMTLEEVRSGAEPVDGSIASHLLRLCRELNVYVGFPLAERRADGRVYNSMIYAGPNGIEGVQSKAVLISMGGPTPPADAAKTTRTTPWQEDEIYTPGTGDGVFTWGGVRVGALICAEGGFPYIYEIRVKKRAQLICHASASPGMKSGDANPMPDVAARRYHRPVVFANRYPNYMYSVGNSQICDADGNILARVGPTQNAVIDALIELPPLVAEPSS